MTTVRLSTAAKVAHEAHTWGAIFAKENLQENSPDFSSYWWRDYYHCISRLFQEILPHDRSLKLLEPGCGSGKASFLLAKSHWQLTLVDIADTALMYARTLSRRWGHPGAQLIKADIFSMPVPDHGFDFVWNLGVIEHYDDEEIVELLRIMIRKARPGGIVAVGFPNFISGPILKAWALSKWPFRFLPGYRLNSERFFRRSQMLRMAAIALKEESRSGALSIETVGNPLPMETPQLILKTIGLVLNRVFPRNRFLSFLIIRTDDVFR